MLTVGLLVGCGSSDPPEMTSVTVSPASVQRGTDVTVNVTVANFELRMPAEEEALTAAEEEIAPATGDYPDGGHFHIYLDDLETNPMLVNCPDYCDDSAFMTSVRARVPDDATAGSHMVIVRLNNDFHMFLNPQIKGQAPLMVTE